MNHLIPQLGRSAMMHLQNGNLSAAEKSLLKILTIDQNEINALRLYGFVLTQKNDFTGAINTFQKILRLNANDPEPLFNLGKAYFDIGDFKKSIQSYKNFLTMTGDHVEVLSDIGVAYQNLEDHHEAIAYFDRAISISTNSSAAYSNKAISLASLNLLDEALNAIEEAIRLSPIEAEHWNNKTDIYLKLQKYTDALLSARRSIELNPKLVEAYVNLGNALFFLKQHKEAEEIYRKTTKLEPNNSQNWIHLGGTLLEMKCYKDALDSYNQASLLKRDHEYLAGNRLHILSLLGQWDSTYDDLLALCKSGLPKLSAPFPLLSKIDDPELHRLTAVTYSNDKYPENFSLGEIPKIHTEKIRIGYFSPDFKNHPVSQLSVGLFEQHDRAKFEIYAFSLTASSEDEITHRLRSSFDHFIMVDEMSDIEIAKLSRELRISIAIDLGGYTQNARTGIFSLRAAPVQVNYLGFPGTMGSSYFDYLISDLTIIPKELRSYYVEKIAYIPSYQVNDRNKVISSYKFSKQELGLPDNSFVFCAFNNAYKLNPELLNSWSTILKQVSNSVLFLSRENHAFAQNLLDEFLFRGIKSNRIIFADRTTLLEDHLARYRVCDLFLDAFPYNAHTTGSDALWAGLPIVTLIGNSFASRVAASLLTNIGLPELITNSYSEYESLAINFGRNPDYLHSIRVRLQNNRLIAPLFDTQSFTRNIEAIYLQMYERYQSDLPPTDISFR